MPALVFAALVLPVMLVIWVIARAARVRRQSPMTYDGYCHLECNPRFQEWLASACPACGTERRNLMTSVELERSYQTGFCGPCIRSGVEAREKV